MVGLLRRHDIDGCNYSGKIHHSQFLGVMCLAVPGKVISIEENSLGVCMGKVSFGGIVKDACLAFTPEARLGDYVIVHAGFAISCLDEEEARQMLVALAELEKIADEQGEPLNSTLR
jgi:hydrogenase expression/formation protein HypC